jgi:two-component system phosphate regulon sensor histidine kinase PhoR
MIFEALTRFDAAQCDGLGIGLLIVRRALGILGHYIDVASTPPPRVSLFPFVSRARRRASELRLLVGRPHEEVPDLNLK